MGASPGQVPHDNHVRRAPARVRHPGGAIPQRCPRVRRHPAQYRLHRPCQHCPDDVLNGRVLLLDKMQYNITKLFPWARWGA